MRLNRKREQTARAWIWRALWGPALLVDGICSTLTVGTLNAGAALEVSRRLAMARISSIKGTT